MYEDAKQVCLDEVADFLTGFPFKSEHYTDSNNSIRLLRGDNIAQGAVRWDGVKRWPADRISGMEGYLLRENDVIIAMDRPWIDAGLKYGRIRPEDTPSLLVQRVARLRGTKVLDGRFLFFVIGGKSFTDYVLGVQTGTAVPHISGGQIKEYTFNLPPIAEQQAIASVLGALDDKIDLNRRMNETLEAMARAIFKDWFVDFGPTRAKAEGRAPYLTPELWSLFPDALDDEDKPVGWNYVPLLSVAKLISGGTPKTDVPGYWGGDIPWASAKDVSQCPDAFLINTERTITVSGLNESSTKIIPSLSTVVVARGATTGRFCMFGAEIAMNQTCYAIHSKDNVPFWTNCAFREAVEGLLQAAHGSVFDTITTRTIEGASVIRPSARLIRTFERVVGSHFNGILRNICESRTLAQLRDLLLPKLMSGEIRLRDAEKAVEQAL